MKTLRALLPGLFLLLPSLAFGQKILSAEEFFNSLVQGMDKVKDYQADVTITQNKDVSHGKLYYKAPDDLRINFVNGQVLVMDSQKLTAYVPQYKVVLVQSYKASTMAVQGFASGKGLAVLQRDYSVGYLTGPSPIPLDDGSREMVVKLKLIPNTATGYSQLILSVEGNRVRRIEGNELNGDTMQLDLQHIVTNKGLPDQLFQYQPPADARVVTDWLFNPEER